jgi:hypothetical protein
VLDGRDLVDALLALPEDAPVALVLSRPSLPALRAAAGILALPLDAETPAGAFVPARAAIVPWPTDDATEALWVADPPGMVRIMVTREVPAGAIWGMPPDATDPLDPARVLFELYGFALVPGKED